jgi:protein-arginine kinase activator protein McsA
VKTIQATEKIETLEAALKKAITDERFEDAAALRDRIQALHQQVKKEAAEK